MIEQLLEEAVELSIEIDEEEVIQAIGTIPSIMQREMDSKLHQLFRNGGRVNRIISRHFFSDTHDKTKRH